MFMSISGSRAARLDDDPDRADDEAQRQQAERLRRAPAPGGRLAHRQEDRRDPAAHQCRREPVHAPRDLHGRLRDEPPGAERGRDDHGEREPEEPLPAEVLDDEAAEDDADPAADPEDGRDQPDPAGDPSGGNSSRMIPNESGKMPPPAPWISRATISRPRLWETAASSVPPPKPASVQTRTCCLPNMSPRRPRSAVLTDAEILPVISDGPYGYQHVNAAEQRRDPNSLLNWTERIIRMRKEVPEVGWGDFEVLSTRDPAVLAIRYDWRNNSVLFVHNLDAIPREVEFSTGLRGTEARVLVNLLTDVHSRAGDDGKHHLLLEAYGYRWYRVGGLDYLLKRSEIETPKER